MDDLDQGIKELEAKNLQTQQQISRLQPLITPPAPVSTPPPSHPSSGISLAQVQELGIKLLASLQSAHPDPLIIQSFAGAFSTLSEDVGIGGINLAPSAAASSATTPAPADTQPAEAGGGGVKRDSSPTPQPQQPNTKEQRT
eukprot:4114655-Karenia_brevis.AAC.1